MLYSVDTIDIFTNIHVRETRTYDSIRPSLSILTTEPPLTELKV